MWGRNIRVDFKTRLLCLTLFATSPVMVFYYIATAFYCDYNLLNGIQCLLSADEFDLLEWTENMLMAINIVIWWFLLQIILAIIPDFIHKILPIYRGGVQKGSISPGGHVYKYNINGLQAWILSLILFIGLSWWGLFDGSVIYDYWGSILVIAGLLAYMLSIIAYIKAYVSPTNPEDCKISNDKFYDIFMGVELNPRSGSFDWKLFLNGRPGIIGWSLINISFAYAQYYSHGSVTNSMLLVNFLQTLYIGYFFYREAWYLKTLDISHDHFGWMFTFGDLVWLPAMYTLQGLFLVNNPIDLSWPYFAFVLVLGCVGFYIFASSNNEKDKFRSVKEHYESFDDKQRKTIRCTYRTADGKIHQSHLLISGWWGVCRHINYTGDIILSLAYSLACGTYNIFPYFYVIFLTILLIHRSIRDDIKCRNKYGSSWEIYRKHVPYCFIPGII